MANPLAFSANEKQGWVRKLGLGWREKSEKTFYWCWCWVCSCPCAKINPRGSGTRCWNGAPGSSRSPVTAVLGQMSLESSGGWERHGCEHLRFLCRQFIETGLGVPSPLPPGWVSEQSEVQVVQPAERARAISGGRRSSTKSSGSHKGCSWQDNPRVQKRELRERAGWNPTPD